MRKGNVLFQLWIADVFLKALSFSLKRKTKKSLSGKPKHPESSLFFSCYVRVAGLSLVAPPITSRLVLVWTSLCPRARHTLNEKNTLVLDT